MSQPRSNAGTPVWVKDAGKVAVCVAAGVVLHVAWQHRPKWLRKAVPKQARQPAPPRKALPTWTADTIAVTPPDHDHAHTHAPATPGPAPRALDLSSGTTPARDPFAAQSSPTPTAAAAAAATALPRQPAYVATDASSVKEDDLVKVVAPAPPVPCCGHTVAVGLAPPTPPPTTMILILGGDVYAPKHLGRRDILIAGGSVAGILEPEDPLVAALTKAARSNPHITVVDASGQLVVPGFVDLHVHLTGGGGEMGPQSRTPRASVPEMLVAGLTTVVGLLGTDTITRSPEDLLATVNAVNASPMTAYHYTGGYDSVPECKSVTGSIQKDIALLPRCIGVGEVAMSDHRGSQPGPDHFRNLVAQARVGGLLGGNAGLMYVHIGTSPDMLQPLWDVIRNTPLPIAQILPTHMTRSQELVDDGLAWVQAGGNVDFTSDHALTPSALAQYFKVGGDAALDHVLVSSDAYGSWPTFDALGNVLSYSYSKPDGLLRTLQIMVKEYHWPLDRALRVVTRNPASIARLSGKGVIATGADGDVVVLGADDLRVRAVVASGVIAVNGEYVYKSMFNA